ncbi:MAG: parvulin-like peptidyl-prolyl isomerase [Bacteroidetes bacterium]|nr:parvulin-like peptidyl-prolyl isomerase [Bacteroidota bacterium]
MRDICLFLPGMLKIKFILLAILFSQFVSAQEVIIDKVIGVVGKYPILLSDLQNTMLDQDKREQSVNKCKAMELLLFQKLLVAQADRDSVTVSDAEVENELSRRMAYFIQQFGSEEKLENYYGKRTNVIKDDLRADIKEQLLAQKMLGKINGEVKLTPAEVRMFYKTIPEDSLPLINSEVELQQIVKKPGFSVEAKKEAREQLEGYRERVLRGETMKKLAILYSEDPGSAKDGGYIANVGRGMMVPEFEAVAFKLKNGEVSTVFETAYGYHFIELVQRKGDLLDLRHILVIPKMTNNDFFRSKQQLDSLYEEIKEGKITFEEAARKFSDDKETKQNGGLMINPATASTKFDNEDLSQMDQNMIVTINAMQLGEVSKPMQFTGVTDGKPAFRLIKLKNRIDPHKTNLKDDYQKLSVMASNDKNRKQVKEWTKKRSKVTYIKLDPEYLCKFESDWVLTPTE